jgi:hypothetical protein
MNLREVIRSGYKVFNRMGEDKRKAHILAIQYIELLANQTNTRMEPWDIAEVFGTGKGSELITDKTEINKKFFAKIEEIKSKTPAEAFALETRIMEQMDALTRASTDREIAGHKRSRDAAIQNATRQFTAGQQYLEQANGFEKQIMALERRESTIPGQISQIVQESFWEFFQLNGPNLDLITRNDVILTHKNSAADVDLRVNFGKFKTTVNLQNMTINVFTHEGNLNLDSFYHPHVYTNGNICWGTAASTVAGKLPKGEIADVLRLLASVLTNYNDGNPYRALAQFQGLAKNDAPPRAPAPPLPPGFAASEPRPAPDTAPTPEAMRSSILDSVLRSGMAAERISTPTGSTWATPTGSTWGRSLLADVLNPRPIMEIANAEDSRMLDELRRQADGISRAGMIPPGIVAGYSMGVDLGSPANSTSNTIELRVNAKGDVMMAPQHPHGFNSTSSSWL